jgi:hypothetical protein
MANTRSLSSITALASLTATVENLLDANSTGTAAISVGEQVTHTFTTGTTAGKADRFWSSRARALTAGNSEDIDVYDLGSLDIGAGAGKDPVGLAFANVDITGILIENTSSSAGDLVIGNNATTAAWVGFFGGDTQAITLKPTSIFFLSTENDPGFAVADTSSHLLRIAASGGDVTYDIHLMCRSA